MKRKISEYSFVARAIKKLRTPPYKGIHSVYSGFNQAFRDYFRKDPVEAINRLVADRKIEIRPVRGGVLIYLPEDYHHNANPKTVLEKILTNGMKSKLEDGPEEQRLRNCVR